ncbi:hypothetical protein Tco_0698347 [Tanacetum coccineum]
MAHPPSRIADQLLAYMETEIANDVKAKKDLMKVYDELNRSLKEKELILVMVKAADLEISMHGDYYGMLVTDPKR